MNASWECTLSLTNLPKKLTSRRNLFAYFSKFGDVKTVSVNKNDQTGTVEYYSHAEAKAAKTLGKMFEGNQLKILWCKNTSETTEINLDPRARELEDVIEIDSLYEDDDKECFGVELKSVEMKGRGEKKKSPKDMISQHLKVPLVRKRLGSLLKSGEMKKSESSVSKISSIKLNKPTSKVLLAKKTLANKQKLLKKDVLSSDKDKKKSSREVGQHTCLSPEVVDLQQKLSLLDERDKLLRQKRGEDFNIETAVAIQGTCLDMCPERERILRQCGHQVAVYESFPGTNEMDENKAVKEYSRSSADQGFPLPHEVRPRPVLAMTMNYLITNIISKIDNPIENKALWYSFCWNRLRSIRKDIYMQQLCDLETVTIVEQVARFHICCYDHMWGNEVSGYEDKINTTNLMQSLQTLKHLYEDLGKRNIKCPNEAEFNAYYILVKLTTGDVFWEFQQYSPELQCSPKVQFAIAVYVAFVNNMYSKFFSLVKQASYLEACLLQRYFDEVRTRALKVMLKAYSLPSKNIDLTTSFLMKCLKFDSRKNVLRFCEKVESSLDKKIEFDEDEIEDEYIATSSYLIREKRLPCANAVVGEHNPLPIYVPHQVHTSFDEDGKLKEALHSDADESFDSYGSPADESDISVPDVRPEPMSESQNKPFKFSLSPQVTKENDLSKNVFSRLGSLSSDSGGSMKTELSENKSTTQSPSKSLFSLNDSVLGNESFHENEPESFQMEEDVDEDMVYDKGNIEEEKGIKPEKPQPLFPQIKPQERSHFGIQQPFSIATTMPSVPVTNNSTLSQNNANPPFNFFTSFPTPVVKPQENFNIFPTVHPLEAVGKFSSNETSDKNSSFKNLGLPVQNNMQDNKTTKFLTQQMGTKPNVVFENRQASAITHVGMERAKENERLAKEEEEKKILQKLLEKKAEEERRKIEEERLAELQRQRKRMEQLKALDLLRKDLRQRMKAKNAKKYCRIWKARVEKLKKKRADFPMLHQLSVASHLELWGKMKNIPSTSIYQRAKDRQKLNIVVSHLLTNGVATSCTYIGRDLAELLARSAARTMNMGSVRPVYWKLVMSLPWCDRSTSQFSVFNQMMKRCCKQTFYKDPNAQLGSVEFVMTSVKIPVHVSVHFTDDLQSCSDLHGIDALIFVVVDGLESEKTCLDRLRSLATSQVRNNDLAVAVMSINGNKYERVLKMELEELHEQGFVEHWTVNVWKTSDSLFENLAFLAEHVRVVPDVCTRTLEVLVKEAVDDFIYEVDASQVYCPTLTNAFQNPNIVIHIYNTFLTKLENLLLSSKLEKYFSLAEEFKSHINPSEWGGPELMCGKQFNYQYKSQISNKINSLKLPEFSGWPDHTNEMDFDSMADLLETYCKTRIEDMDVYINIIRKMALEDPHGYQNTYGWLHIVEMWAECRLSRVFSSKEKGSKMLVIYNKSDLQRMIKKQWWIFLPVVVQANKNM